VARAAGGALETVVDGVTGCFWTGDSDDLAAAVAGFDTVAIDPQACVKNAARFDSSVFRGELSREVDAALRTPPEERPAGGARPRRRPSHARRPWPPPVRPTS
jgi:hypothetical protein